MILADLIIRITGAPGWLCVSAFLGVFVFIVWCAYDIGKDIGWWKAMDDFDDAARERYGEDYQ